MTEGVADEYLVCTKIDSDRSRQPDLIPPRRKGEPHQVGLPIVVRLGQGRRRRDGEEE
jgi:hypothetical protein